MLAVSATDLRSHILHLAGPFSRRWWAPRLRVSSAAQNGMTPLHLAARDGNVDVVQGLILAGVEVNAKAVRAVVRCCAMSSPHQESPCAQG